MKNILKNNKEGGFLKLIIIIIIALLIMKYFGITLSEIFDKFLAFFRSVLR